jgi:hypothetical protein
MVKVLITAFGVRFFDSHSVTVRGNRSKNYWEFKDNDLSPSWEIVSALPSKIFRPWLNIQVDRHREASRVSYHHL